jgi:hypothetical protein
MGKAAGWDHPLIADQMEREDGEATMEMEDGISTRDMEDGWSHYS